MRFRTEYIPEKSPFLLDPSRPTVLLGSCFADNLGNRMRSCLWEAENPLGTLYNPLSIAEALRVALSQSPDDLKESTDPQSLSGLSRFEQSLFYADGMWRSWLFDSKFAAETAEDVRNVFIEKSRRLQEVLRDAEVLFVTFGTSLCYYLRKTCDYTSCETTAGSSDDTGSYLVANCHKQPASMFSRKRLTIKEITGCWTEIVNLLHERYPGLKIVFTVSPVRHLKDGFTGNSRSKAILQLAVEELCEKLEICYYFPAYEIVNDDLRDYRFYASDLVHPSDEAVEYIWEIFKTTYIGASGLARLKEGESIRKGLDHRPLPNATRNPSPAMLAKEEARISLLQERLRKFKKSSQKADYEIIKEIKSVDIRLS